jgi:hypothetical protein
MHRPALTVALLTLAVATFPSRVALALPEFPRKIESQLSLTYEPPCSICHQYGKTGPGTVITPFGFSLRTRGLNSDDKSSLTTALTSDQSDAEDSDGDGIPDTVELVNGTDPNSPANGSIVPSVAPAAQLGCGVSQRHTGSASAIASGIFLCFVVARDRLRRRRFPHR